MSNNLFNYFKRESSLCSLSDSSTEPTNVNLQGTSNPPCGKSAL